MIESGVIELGKTDFLYPVNCGNATEEVPGSVSSTYFDTGFLVEKVNLEDLYIVISVDLTDRILLSNDDTLYLKRSAVITEFRYVSYKIDNTLLAPKTVFFLEKTTQKEKLYRFISSAGLPHVQDTFCILSHRVQSNMNIDYYKDMCEIQKSFSDNKYDITFNFSLPNDIKESVFRWRETPSIYTETPITYNVEQKGAYSSVINTTVSSVYGKGENIFPICGVTEIVVNEGGLFESTPNIRVVSSYGWGCKAVPIMQNGSIDHIEIEREGTDYIGVPEIIIEGGNVITPAILEAHIGIIQINTTTSGNYYFDEPILNIVGEEIIPAVVTINRIVNNTHTVNEWNYIRGIRNSFLVSNLDKDKSYEWQLFTREKDANTQNFNTPVQTLTL